MMPIAYDTEQRIQNIENSIRRIEEVLMATTMHTGNHRTYHEPIEMDGYWGALSQLLSHGKFGHLIFVPRLIKFFLKGFRTPNLPGLH